MIDRRQALGLMAVGLFARPARAQDQQDIIGDLIGTNGGPAAVVELFTSQGCSSCPPADLLQGVLADDPRFVALTYPVDYWDYLGWKDTLARPENTERQKAYARVRGDRSVYTPQMIINGRAEIVGSRASALQRAVNQGLDMGQAPNLPVSLAADDEVVTVDVGSGAPRKTTVYLVTFLKQDTVKIGRGENAGRTVTYRNVVKYMRPVGMWTGESMHFVLPRREIMPDEGVGCAVIVQEEAPNGPGPILGAAMLTRLGSSAPDPQQFPRDPALDPLSPEFIPPQGMTTGIY